MPANQIKESYYHRDESQKVTPDVLLRMFPGAEIRGTLQKTGIVVVKDGIVLSALRHPDFVQRSTQNVSEIILGGDQTIGLLERSLLIPTKEKTTELAREALSMYPTAGVEAEMYVYHPVTGEVGIAKDPYDIELQKGLAEGSTPGGRHVAKSPEQLAVYRAQLNLQMTQKLSPYVALDTGTPVSFGGKTAHENPGMEICDSRYVQVMVERLRSHLIPWHKLDKHVQHAVNQYAQLNGYQSYDQFRKEAPFAEVMPFAASHISVGLPTMKLDDGTYRSSAEIAIGVADMFNSDLATLAVFLTQGSPLVGGKLFTIEGGRRDNTHVISDARTFLRLSLDTTYPSPFIHDLKTLQKRQSEGIMSGGVNTLDRAAFTSMSPDGEQMAQHARVRLRGAGNPNIPLARVEFTEGSATPSVYDAVARDAYLIILRYAALEALANGQHPQEYYKDIKSISEWKNEGKLAIQHAVYGPKEPDVQEIIAQNRRLLDDMSTKYEHLRPLINFVVSRVENLTQKAPNTITEYTNHPRGRIADTIIAMKQNGVSDMEIIRQLNENKIITSQRIIACNGDFTKLLAQVAA